MSFVPALQLYPCAAPAQAAAPLPLPPPIAYHSVFVGVSSGPERAGGAQSRHSTSVMADEEGGSDTVAKKKKNADAQAAFRARRQSYIHSLEETVSGLEDVVRQMQTVCKASTNEAKHLRAQVESLTTRLARYEAIREEQARAAPSDDHCDCCIFKAAARHVPARPRASTTTARPSPSRSCTDGPGVHAFSSGLRPSYSAQERVSTEVEPNTPWRGFEGHPLANRVSNNGPTVRWTDLDRRSSQTPHPSAAFNVDALHSPDPSTQAANLEAFLQSQLRRPQTVVGYTAAATPLSASASTSTSTEWSMASTEPAPVGTPTQPQSASTPGFGPLESFPSFSTESGFFPGTATPAPGIATEAEAMLRDITFSFPSHAEGQRQSPASEAGLVLSQMLSDSPTSSEPLTLPKRLPLKRKHTASGRSSEWDGRDPIAECNASGSSKVNGLPAKVAKCVAVKDRAEAALKEMRESLMAVDEREAVDGGSEGTRFETLTGAKKHRAGSSASTIA